MSNIVMLFVALIMAFQTQLNASGININPDYLQSVSGLVYLDPSKMQPVPYTQSSDSYNGSTWTIVFDFRVNAKGILPLLAAPHYAIDNIAVAARQGNTYYFFVNLKCDANASDHVRGAFSMPAPVDEAGNTIRAWTSMKAIANYPAWCTQ